MRERLSPQCEDLRRRAVADEPGMPAAYKRELKSAVLARIALAAPGTLAAGQAPASGMGLGAKVVIGLALVGALGAGGRWTLRAAPRSVRADAQARPEAPPGLAPVAMVAAEPLPVVVAKPAPATRVRGKGVVERRVFRGVLAPPSTLSREAALLGEADRALRRGDTASASALLDEHAAAFPNGTLAPERTAERLLVSCRAGDADPRAVAAFLAANPGSPLAARVTRACAHPAPAPRPAHL